MPGSHLPWIFYKVPYTGEISEGVFAKDQITKERFKKETYMCVVNEQDTQFPGNDWVMIYQGKKKTYSTDSLARDLYQLWLQAQEVGLPSIQKILMFLPKIMWSLSYVSRMQIGKRIRHGIADPNEEFIYDYIKEKLCIVKTQREDSEMSSNLSEALEVYRPAWLILTIMKISIEETDAPETGLRLIEPGNGCLARLLETLFRWSITFRLHALYHDVFWRICLKTKKRAGYTYVFRNCIFKGSPLFGYLTRLLSCILFFWGGRNIGKMILNKILFFVFISKILRSENSHKKLYWVVSRKLLPWEKSPDLLKTTEKYYHKIQHPNIFRAAKIKL